MDALGRDGCRARAVAPVVGVVLLFGIVAAGAGIVFVTGLEAKQSVQDATAVDRAETNLQAAGSTFASLAHAGNGTTATVDLGGVTRSDVRVERDGTLRVRVNDDPACSAAVGLGTLVAEHDSGVAVAYQAGGVFKRSSSGTTLVQSPELDYRTESMDGHAVRTISFPVTNVSGDVRSATDVVASTAASGDSLRDDLCLSEAGAVDVQYVREITITVEGSDYYRAWHRYFRQEFGGAGEYDVDHDAQSASVTAPLGAGVHPDQFALGDVHIYGGVFAGSSAGELSMQTKHATVDSYDADDGPWMSGEPTYGDDGDVLTRGDLHVQANGARVAGDVYAAGVVSLSTSCGAGGAYCIDGSVVVNNSTAGGSGPTTALYPTGSAARAAVVSGSWRNGTVIPAVPPMNDRIDHVVGTVETYNDNDDVGVVAGDAVQYSGGSATLSSGVYYLDELDVPAGNTLTIDTSGGDVVLAVDGDVSVGDGATVAVTGPGQVRAYVGEDASGTDDQLTVGRQAAVVVRDGGARTYRSSAFVVACKAGCDATFERGTGSTPTQFTGVLYGPGDESDAGTVSLDKHVEVWGALVAGTVTFEQQSSLHFDTTLQNRAMDADDDGILDVADADSDFPDGDGDGFSETEDACPDAYGTGENGCRGVGENETANALVVNQTSATVTVIGSQVADEYAYETTTETRTPLNVELVIDDSGSMNLYENYGFEDPYGQPTYDHVSGPHEIPEDGSVTVPEGVAYVADDDDDGDVEADGEVFYPGEVLDGDDWSYYHEVDVEGNDVFWERLPAARAFVGALDPDVDEVGVVRFDLTSHEEQALTSNFDAVNATLARSTFSSDGGTNLYTSLDDAIARLEAAEADDEAAGVETQETIVLLTDGKHSDAAPGDEADIEALAEEAHDKGIRIYVVALGDPADYNADLLEYVANEDGDLNESVDGRLYAVQNATTLSEKFEQIAVDSKTQRTRTVQHPNASTTVHVGADAVSFGENTNPTDGTYPTTTIDAALDPGDLVHVSTTTYECATNETVATTTNPSTDETYDVTRCADTDAVDAVTTNDDHANHQVFTDDDSIPAVHTSAWYKDEDANSLRAVVERYDADLVDGDTFDLPENDAIILVNRSDDEPGDQDFVVLYVEATDHAPPAPSEQTVDADPPDGTALGNPDRSNGARNDYVVDVGVDHVNVTDDRARVAPADDAPASVALGAHHHAVGTPDDRVRVTARPRTHASLAVVAVA